MPKLVILGIDGMDARVVEHLGVELPNLHSLGRHHQYRRCESVFPPDSIPAWATIYTGRHPAAHGWLDNVDYEDIRRGTSAFDVQRLQGNCFWDVASARGNRVCVVNPLLAYPAWPVNGVMISGPVFVTGEVQSYPPEIARVDGIPEMGGMTDFPAEDNLEGFVERTLQSTTDLATYGLRLHAMEDWDLFFLSFFTLDRLQHFLWRFYDVEDPTYPGPSSLGRAIPILYRLFDDIIGEFARRCGPDTQLLVLSDHGHGRRPLLQFHVNEVLRRAGLLRIPQGGSPVSPARWVEQAKNAVLQGLARYGLENMSYTIARLIPSRSRKALKKSSFMIDRINSTAWASDMGGGASVGGVEVNPRIRAIGGAEYDQACYRVAAALEEHGHSASGDVLRWVRRGTELSHDDGLCAYPDVVFELAEDYSVGRSLFTDVVARNPRHLRISGGHKTQGVCFLRGGAFPLPEPISLLDMFPLVVSSLAAIGQANYPPERNEQDRETVAGLRDEVQA